jgi:FtsP/CotA-like multicopper oxidase with cupredoxin domain
MIYSSLIFATVALAVSHFPTGIMAATLNPMTTVTSADGFLNTIINVDQFFFEEAHTGTKLWTRAYNPPSVSGDTLHPGPVLKFRRGDQVTVTLNNLLGPETMVADDMNSFHYANTTNLHTHGLHISAEVPQDNVLITIHPQGMQNRQADQGD